MKLRIAGLLEDSIVDGPGLRLIVFTQGCFRHCKGCHNPDTHDPAGGYLADTRDIAKVYERNVLLSGVTFSGGEPFLHSGPLTEIANAVHRRSGSVMTYTGYTLEEIMALTPRNPLLDATDILVDGPFIQALASKELQFRGSSNQRIFKKGKDGQFHLTD